MVKKIRKNLLIIIVLLFFIASSILAYSFNREVLSLQEDLSSKDDDYLKKISANELKFIEQQEIISLLEKDLEEEKESYDLLEESFDDLEGQIRKITKSVGTLEKLKETDPELLAKYSKVYFLNEHYSPKKVSSIDTKYLYNEDSGITISSQVLPFLEDLLEKAERDEMDLKILSGYRSYDKQQSIKQTYINIYGSQAADTFSADQGKSEHQLGTTVDFTTEILGGNLGGFINSDQYTWLTENAHKYGFVLSYPDNNQYYTFEPWHWRFVGKDLADDLYDDGKFLYDVPQRELDKYLAEIFD